MVRCDSDDYGAVNPLFSSPALVRPSPLRAGPVAEGTEEGQDLHEALTRQGFSLQESSSSSHHSGLHWGQQEQSAGPSSSRLWSGLTHWLQKPKSWLATGKHGGQGTYEDAADHEAEPDAGRLRTDMIAIDVPSSRCSSVSHQSESRGQHDDLESEAGEGGLPLPPLSTSSSPTRRLTKQASDAAAAVLLAISDANPIPRSPKPGPAPNRSWFVDVSPRRSLASLRTSPHMVHQLQPVSVAASRSFTKQLWRRHCLDLVVTVVLALLLGLLHGPAWQLQEVPAAALGATLSFGLLSLLAALPVFASSLAGSIAALYCPALHFLLNLLLHLVIATLRSAIFAAIYVSLAQPLLRFSSFFTVILLVACWCSGMGFLLARLLPSTQLAGSSLAILVALGACLNGVFPTLRELHSTPWFLISGKAFCLVRASQLIALQSIVTNCLEGCLLRPESIMFQHLCCGVPTWIKYRYLLCASPAVADHEPGYCSTCSTSAFGRWYVAIWPVHMVEPVNSAAWCECRVKFHQVGS